MLADAMVTGRYKEADKIAIPALPDAVRYRSSRVAVREELMGASGRPELAFEWIRQLDNPQTSYDALGDSGLFMALDMKLAAALSAKASGEIGRKLLLRKEAEYKEGRLVKGRQMLYLIHDYYKVNEEAGSMYELQDLMHVQIKGENSEGFLNTWDSVLFALKFEQSEEVLRVLFLQQLAKCSTLQEELAHYQRFSDSDPNADGQAHVGEEETGVQPSATRSSLCSGFRSAATLGTRYHSSCH